MNTVILNGTPSVRSLGTDDQSKRTVPNEPEVLPTHLPKVYTYAKTGPTTPELVVGKVRETLFGAESFDIRSKYSTHQTVLSNILNSAGNAQMLQRLKPLDAGPNASIRLWIDILETEVPVYERMPDGSIVLDIDGLKVESGAVTPGYIARWVATQVLPDVSGEDTFASAGLKPGKYTDAVTGTQSVLYPIMDFRVPHFGEYGNNTGLRIWAPTIKSAQVLDDRILTNEKVYPFRMACVARRDSLSTARPVNTLGAEPFKQVCFRPNTLDRNTEEELYAGDVFIQAWQQEETAQFGPSYGPFGRMHTYDANVEEILDLVYATELAHIDFNSDIDGSGDDKYLLNLLGAYSSNGTPYTSLQIAHDGLGTVRMSENATIFASGGSDGTMSEALFSDLVRDAVEEYGDENSPLQNTAKYPESIMYDTGFKLDCKMSMLNFISLRVDTACILSTHDVLGITLTAAQESSLAIALRTKAQSYPESDTFGTHVMRAMIVGRSGKLLNSQYRKRLPLTLEIAQKAARYMGAGNGRWKPGLSFGAQPLSKVSMFTEVNETFAPFSVRNKDWTNGLVWVESLTRRTVFFPALKTVYDDDTSVLNSFFTMMACVELQKVGHRSWREFTGTDNMTDEEFAKAVDKFITKSVAGRFDDRFVIIPQTYYTEADTARGYSWHTKIVIHAGNMKTVATINLESRRLSDLAEKV